MTKLPKARGGLLASDHSKRGRRFVTILDAESSRVTLLEPWEHAVLLLCDGTRTPESIAELLAGGVDEVTVDIELVHKALKAFDRQALMESVGPPKKFDPSIPGPKTMAALQQAYKEWHMEPLKTGQFIGRPPPTSPTVTKPAPGLGPTVAVPDTSGLISGSTLLSEATAAAGERLDVLGAINEALGEAELMEAQTKSSPPKKRTLEMVVVEARPPDSGVHQKMMSKVEVSPDAARPKARPEEHLRPTIVGAPPLQPMNDPPTQPGALAHEAEGSGRPPRKRAFSEGDQPTVEIEHPRRIRKDAANVDPEPPKRTEPR